VTHAEPTSEAERITAIDVIRGFALLGVLLMNSHFWFRAPEELYDFSRHPWPGTLDVLADNVLMAVFAGKAFTLFSFLFGVGLAIQLEHLEARGVGFAGFAFRRLTALFAIGVLHVTLLWTGDIVHHYAVLGFVLLFFLRRRPWILAAAGIALVLAPAVLGRLVPRHVDNADDLLWIVESTRVYQSGGWWETMLFRWRHYWRFEDLGLYLRFYPYSLGLFLLGTWAWRRGILRAPDDHRTFLRRFLWIGVPIALALVVGTRVWPNPVLRVAGSSLGTPLLGLSYGAAILLLWQRRGWQRVLAPLAPLGKMALTNYLFQSLAMTWIYGGYGLRQFGRLGPAAGAVVALGVFAVEVLLSRWWLAHHRFGPVEWLWRRISYAR
jgi:uncharacterized protein